MSTVEFLHQPKSSKIIYFITLIAITLALCSTPFIYVTVSIKGYGTIKSNIEKMELISPISGRLLHVNVRDNQKVVRGTTLVILDGSLSKMQRNILSNHGKNLNDLLHDAEKLIKTVNSKYHYDGLTTKTGLYASSWQHYSQQFRNATNTMEHAERIFKRYKTLYQKNVVTKAEFEQHQFSHDQAMSDKALVSQMHVKQWQREAIQYRQELGELQRQKVQLGDELQKCTVKATINGSIQNLIGIRAGTFIYANQKIGEINPDGILYAYCFVHPSDIGLIKKGQLVHFRIDAFNHNQWGVLVGRVLDISDDTLIRNQQHYFKITCRLNTNYLQLKSGYKGFIRKGMTFTANFTLDKRSLYQLLYNSIDDWAN